MKKAALFYIVLCMALIPLSAQTNLSYFQAIPKAELHLHLSGAYPKEYLFSIATEDQKVQLEKAVTQVAQKIDYRSVFAVFQWVHQIVNTEEKVTKGVEALCLALKEDGVSYVEIRSGLKNLGHGTEAYLKAILDGIDSQHHLQATLLLSLQRNSPLATVRETIDLALKYRDQGVVGIDLSGDATTGQIETILPELLRGKANGLPFVIHIGESPNEQDQMMLLTQLSPVRVGHGVYLSPEATAWIFSHHTPLEVCLTSSVLVQMIDRFDQHPGLQFFRKGHPIVLCTDDPLLFSTTLSQECLLAQEQAGLAQAEVETIAREAIRYKL